MCFVRITVAADELFADTAAGLAENIGALCARVLRQNPGVVSVLVERVRPLVWSVADAPSPLAAHLEATICTGTTTPEDRARFVRTAGQQLAGTLGILPEVTYVVVREVPAGDWGFSGRTFAERAPAV